MEYAPPSNLVVAPQFEDSYPTPADPFGIDSSEEPPRLNLTAYGLVIKSNEVHSVREV